MAEPIAETIAEPTTEIVAELDAINQPTEETETVKDPITETMIEFGTEAVLESRTDGEVQNDSVELTAEIVKKGLKTLGVNPLTLKHALLELNLINEKIRSIEILRDYPNIMYMNLSSNAIDSLQALQHLPTLVQLNIRYITMKRLQLVAIKTIFLFIVTYLYKTLIVLCCLVSKAFYLLTCCCCC